MHTLARPNPDDARRLRDELVESGRRATMPQFDPETRLYAFQVESLAEAGLVVSDVG